MSLEVGANGRGLMSAIAEPPHMAHTAAQVFHCQNSCLNCSCSAAAGQQRTSRPGRRADGPTDQPTGICGASQVLQARVSNTSTSSSTLLRRRRRAAAESGRRSHCGSSAGRPGRPQLPDMVLLFAHPKTRRRLPFSGTRLAKHMGAAQSGNHTEMKAFDPRRP